MKHEDERICRAISVTTGVVLILTGCGAGSEAVGLAELESSVAGVQRHDIVGLRCGDGVVKTDFKTAEGYVNGLPDDYAEGFRQFRQVRSRVEGNRWSVGRAIDAGRAPNFLPRSLVREQPVKRADAGFYDFQTTRHDSEFLLWDEGSGRVRVRIQERIAIDSRGGRADHGSPPRYEVGSPQAASALEITLKDYVEERWSKCDEFCTDRDLKRVRPRKLQASVSYPAGACRLEITSYCGLLLGQRAKYERRENAAKQARADAKEDLKRSIWDCGGRDESGFCDSFRDDLKRAKAKIAAARRILDEGQQLIDRRGCAG